MWHVWIITSPKRAVIWTWNNIQHVGGKQQFVMRHVILLSVAYSADNSREFKWRISHHKGIASGIFMNLINVPKIIYVPYWQDYDNVHLTCSFRRGDFAKQWPNLERLYSTSKGPQEVSFLPPFFTSCSSLGKETPWSSQVQFTGLTWSACHQLYRCNSFYLPVFTIFCDLFCLRVFVFITSCD